MSKKRKRFTNENKARSFAKKVGGQVNDCRDIVGAKSRFTVTYTPNSDGVYRGKRKQNDDWCPEEGRDFGYPNEFWK